MSVTVITQRNVLMDPISKSPKLGVLVVDAEYLILTFLTYALTDQNFEVFTCRTGEQAVELLQNQADRIDVMLVDVGDGLSNFKQVHERAPHIPCCAMSAVLSVTEEAELRELGAAAVLPKPFRLDSCLHVLRSIAVRK